MSGRCSDAHTNGTLVPHRAYHAAETREEHGSGKVNGLRMPSVDFKLSNN
jgi:hypothetical protein